MHTPGIQKEIPLMKKKALFIAKFFTGKNQI